MVIGAREIINNDGSWSKGDWDVPNLEMGVGWVGDGGFWALCVVIIFLLVFD